MQLIGMGQFSWIERGIEGRKIKEALFINAQNPAKEVHHKKIMNLEKGLTLDPVWAGFNESFREIMSRKIKAVV